MKRNDMHVPSWLVWLSLFVFVLLFATVGKVENAEAASRAKMSWYGPGFYGKQTSCGKTLTRDSLWVAALHPSVAHCGMRVTIWAQGRKYHVKVYDRGAWRYDGRMWDAAPGLRRRIGFYGVIPVRWQRGWVR